MMVDTVEPVSSRARLSTPPTKTDAMNNSPTKSVGMSLSLREVGALKLTPMVAPCPQVRSRFPDSLGRRGTPF